MRCVTCILDNIEKATFSYINLRESYTTGLGGATTYISPAHEGAGTLLSFFSEER